MKYRVYGEIAFREYADLGEAKNKIGAWIIKRKFRKMGFKSMFTASRPDEMPMIGRDKVYKMQ